MKVTLNWSAVPAATGYKIYRSVTSGSGYKLCGTLPTNTTKWEDGNGNLPTGQTFFYVVTSVNADGESLFSNQFTATAPAFPSPPVISGTAV